MPAPRSELADAPGRRRGAASRNVARIDAQRRERLAKAFRGFLPIEDRARHPTYWAICRGVAEDPSLLALADVVPAPQLPVNVFLASVHHLLLEGVPHALATHYPSVCERRALSFEPVDEAALVASFTDFCHAHEAAVAERCAVRATQTNEVGRAAVLRCALALAGADGEALGLLDAGCSAGLNLLVDAYRCELGDMAAGPLDARVVLRCELLGALPPLALPPIVARVGLDLSPIDPEDPDAVSWLLACLWPDDLERFERLEAALELARARADELVLVRGDMVDGLEAAARRVDAPHLVVVNSWAAPYLEPARRARLRDEVAALAEHRRVTWISMEGPHVLHDLGLLDRGVALRHPGASVVTVTTFAAGRARVDVAAETHAHGRWLDWRPVGAQD